jgi:hypothetical protein
LLPVLLELQWNLIIALIIEITTVTIVASPAIFKYLLLSTSPLEFV